MLILASLCFELLKLASDVAKVGESWIRCGSPAKTLGRSTKVFEPYVVNFLIGPPVI